VFKVIVFSILYFLTSLSFANYNENNLASAFKEYKQGAYQKSLDLLENVSGNAKVMQTKYYLQGLANNRIQAFDRSLVSFSMAKKYGSKAKDLFFEYGQALYANSELEKARKSFELSYKEAYKKSSSLYYIAHISQLLEEHKKAKKYYLKVIKSEKKDLRLVQVARFQLSESLLAMAEKRDNARKIVKKHILPQLEKAKNYLPNTDLAQEIAIRKKEIQRRYHLDPDVMRNGRVLPNKRWNININQDLTYDNNVAFSTEAPTSVAATESESYIHNTFASMSYLFSPRGKYTITPKLDFIKVKHSDRQNSSIYTNDSYSLVGSVNTTFDHKVKGRQASLLLDLGYNYYARDALAIQDVSFFSRTTYLLLGEKFNFFDIGSTKITFKYQDLKGYTESINYKNMTLYLEQIGITKKGNMWIFSTQAALFDNYNATTNSTNQYTFNFNYYIPNLFYKTTFSAGLSVAFLDTKEQKETRGTEKSISPTISLSREVTKKITATLSNTYTRNKSLDLTNYDYKKNVSTFGLSVSF
jgi:hypothetical protein